MIYNKTDTILVEENHSKKKYLATIKATRFYIFEGSLMT